MNLTESFLTALDSLSSNKLRSLLTMLGVIIGVAAVIGLLGIGNGFRASVEDDINAIGTNLIFIFTNGDNSDGYPALSVEDVEALKDRTRVPDVVDVAASVSGGYEILARGQDFQGNVTGVTVNYFPMNGLDDDVLAGGFFTEFDNDSRSRVAVIGWNVAEDLFPDDYPIGETVKINGGSYEVIGMLAESEGGVGANPNDVVYIPLSTHQSRLGSQRTRQGRIAVSQIIATGADADRSDQAMEQITEVLRDQHDIAYASDDDFTLLAQGDLLETVNQILGTVTLFLGAVAGISLLVGGIGIMNIMLVSVTERTREIGIRKSMGALRRNILTQFLIESLILSLIGGLIGIALGWAIAVAGGRAIDVTGAVDANSVSLAVGFSMAVGIVFGIYPAWRAARLRPIDALRYE
ncbi:MAG: ABC transporter permease [Candidatus Promineifilaceae bacterium]